MARGQPFAELDIDLHTVSLKLKVFLGKAPGKPYNIFGVNAYNSNGMQLKKSIARQAFTFRIGEKLAVATIVESWLDQISFTGEKQGVVDQVYNALQEVFNNGDAHLRREGFTQ